MIGNRIDLPENLRKVPFEVAKKYADENQMEYFETSAKNDDNSINILFDAVAHKLRKKFETE